MDLSEMLANAVEKVPGAVAITLLGVDGVVVETVNGAKMTPPDDAAPRPQVAPAWEVELADLMLAARRAARSLRWGALRNITLETGHLTFLARMINPDYFLLLVVNKNGNVGRARFELRRVGAALAHNL